MAETDKPDLVITRVYDAPARLVFKAWTDAEQVAKWWGPRDFTSTVHEWDVRPGGAIHLDMRGPDGTVYPMKGRFEEIVEPERLVLLTRALEDESGAFDLEVRNTITLVERAGKTTLTMTAHVLKATPAASFALEGMEEGWTQQLERLTDLLKTL